MGVTIFHGIFPYIFHIRSECENYKGIFHGIMSIPQNIIMDLNNVMELHTYMWSCGSFRIMRFDVEYDTPRASPMNGTGHDSFHSKFKHDELDLKFHEICRRHHL